MTTSGARLVQLDASGVSSREVQLGARITIGRAPINSLVFNDRELSKSHAEIFADGDGYMVCDLGSSNGTFVNGKRLAPHDMKVLHNGDEIRLGNLFARIYFRKETSLF